MLEITTEDNKNSKYRIHHYKFSNIITDEDFKKYKYHILGEFQNNNKFYAIQDVLNVKDFKMNYMKYFMGLDKLFKDKILVRNYVGATVILVNKKNRKIFDLVFKLRKTETPNKIVTSLEEAVTFIFSL